VTQFGCVYNTTQQDPPRTDTGLLLVPCHSIEHITYTHTSFAPQSLSMSSGLYHVHIIPLRLFTKDTTHSLREGWPTCCRRGKYLRPSVTWIFSV